MTTHFRRRFFASISIPLLLLAGCAGVPTNQDTAQTIPAETRADRMSGTFPVPYALEDNVAFWRNVYGTWGRGQVVLHDNRYLGVIYEVVDLPGPPEGGYTAEQRDLLNAREAALRDRLANLEAKEVSGEALTTDEKALHDKIASVAGPQAIAGAQERLRSQRGLRERFRRGVEISGRYNNKFREVFRSAGLPEDLAYLPHVESSFQVNARSSVGAAGVWQFMPSTGKLYMQVGDAVDERLDPVTASEGAARYLQDAYSRLGSWPLAVTSYNHGVGGMKQAKDRFGDDFGRIVVEYDGPYFGFASRNFYAEFLAAREVASNPTKYFPEGVRYEEPLTADRLLLSDSMPAHHIARHYGLETETLAELNLAWLEPTRKGRTHVPAGTKVWLPQGSLQRVASEPSPAPVVVAKAEPPAKPAKGGAATILAKADTEPKTSTGSKPATLAKADRVVSNTKGGKELTKVRLHVVKANETLYRVADQYDMSVDELRRLNRISAKDNVIHPGQRLRVSI